MANMELPKRPLFAPDGTVVGYLDSQRNPHKTLRRFKKQVVTKDGSLLAAKGA